MADLDIAIKIAAQNNASSALGAIENALHGLGRAASAPISALGSVVSGLGAIGLAANGLGALGSAFSGMAADAAEAQKVSAQTNAVLASTHGVSGMTAESIDDLANALSKVTPFEDETVKSAQNMLLTFTNIGKDVFPQATETVLDMAQALGEDTQAAAMQLGKALNDPIQGVTALRRVGVQLTDAQQAQIESLVKTGDVMGAQKIILRELATEFGGSARAAGQTFGGQMKILETQIGNLKEAAFTPLLGVISQFATGLTEFVSGDTFMEWVSSTAETVANLATGAFSLFGDAVDTVKAIFEAFTGDAGAIGVVYDIIRKVFGDTVGDFVQPFLQAFMDLIPTIQEFASTIGSALSDPMGTLTNLWGQLQDAMSPFAPTGERIQAALSAIGDAIGQFVPSPLMEMVQGMLDAGQNMADAATTGGGLENAFHQVGDAVNNVSDAIQQATTYFGEHKELQAVLIGVLGSVGAAIVLNTGYAVAHAIALAASTLATNALAFATGALTAVMEANPIGLLIIALAGLAAGLVFVYNTNEDFRNGVNAAWAALQQFAAGAAEAASGAFTAVREKLGQLVAFLAGLPDTVSQQAAAIGSAITNGISNALSNTWNGLVGKLKGLVDLLPAEVRKLLGIGSPSREFELIGENIVEGLDLGIIQGIPKVKAAARTLGDSILSEMVNYTDGLGSLMQTTIDKLADIGTKAGRATVDAVSQTLDAMKQAAENAADAITGAVESLQDQRGTRAQRDAIGAIADDDQRAHSRMREDQERGYQLTRDLAKAKTQAERDQIVARYQDAQSESQRKRRIEDEDRAWNKAEDAKIRALEDGLADQALAKQLGRLIEDRNKRISTINEALEFKKAKIALDADNERAVLLDSLEKRSFDLKEQLLDKIPALTGQAQVVLNTFMDRVAERVASLVDLIISQMARAVTSISDVAPEEGGPELPTGPAPGGTLLSAGFASAGITTLGVRSVGGGGMNEDRLAGKIAAALAQQLPNVQLSVGINSVQSELLKLQRRNVSTGLA